MSRGELRESRSARPLLVQEDERQIPWYHLSSPAPRDAGLFKYGAMLRLYSITVTGEPVSAYRA